MSISYCWVGSFPVTIDFFLFPLGGVDFILGIVWLQTLGEVRVNWAIMQMTLDHGGKSITLTGNPSSTWASILASKLYKIRC